MTLARPKSVEAPESAVAPVAAHAAPSMSLSRRLWDLDWSAVLPWVFDDVTVEYGTYDDARPFVAEHYPSIFGDATANFFAEGMTEAKARFWREMDVFLFRHEGRTVGMTAGHPSDWSTYYVRTFALLRECRERGLATQFGRALDATLRAVGVERCESDTSPANQGMLRFYLNEGYVATATMNSERWGSVIRFTKFYGEESASVFRRQFLAVPDAKRPHAVLEHAPAERRRP